MFRGKWGGSQCRKVRGVLSEYIDNRLDGEKKTLVERHLQKCEACSKELESLQMTVQLLHRVPEVPVPRSFMVTVSKPKRESALGSASLRWLRPATAIIAIALVVLLAGDFLNVFVADTGVGNEGNATYIRFTPSAPTEQQTVVAVPGVMGKMSLAAAKAVGYTDYTVLPSPAAFRSTIGPAPSVLTDEAPTAAGVIVQGQTGVGWPLRQIEIGLGAVVFILLALMIFAGRWRKARAAVK
jgi:hypothetical protein